MHGDLNKFVEWQKEAPKRRAVTIKIGEFGIPDHLKIWVYDYVLGVGQMVSDASEIDLVAKKEKDEQKKYQELKAKFEGVAI